VFWRRPEPALTKFEVDTMLQALWNIRASVLTSFRILGEGRWRSEKRMSPEEFVARMREAEAVERDLRAIVERREAAAREREEKGLRRRRPFGLLPL
jgi:hypothetical protein